MPSPGRPEHGAAAPTGGRGLGRTLLPATAVVGAVIGASATIWLRVDHNNAARELVAAGLVAIALLAATLAMRLGEQRRWRRLVEQFEHPATAGFPGGLAAQAEAARQFVGADGAAVVWADERNALTTAAVAGTVPDPLVAGTPLNPTTFCAGPGTPTRWLGSGDLDPSDPCRLPGLSAAGRPLPLTGGVAGTLVVWSARPTPWGLVRLARAARAGAAAIERARLDDAERRSRLGASHARRHLAMLVGASAALARAIDDWQPALNALASEIVPVHADYFAVDLVGDDGTITRVVGAHIDPSREAEAGHPGDESGGWRLDLRGVLRRGETMLFRDARGERPPIATVPHAGDGIVGLHERLDLESWAIVPIRARDTTIGALSVGTRAPRRGLRPSDVETYEELAARSALTLERVKLYRETQAAARAAQANAARLVRAVETAPTLASSLNVADLLQRAARQAFRTMDARLAAVQFERRGSSPVVAWWPAVPSFQDGARELLDVATATHADGGVARGTTPRPWIAVPIVLPRSTSSGVLVVDRPAGQEFTREEESVLLLLSQVTDAAIRHAEVYEAAVTNERRLQALVEASPLAIIEVDPGGEVRSANPAAAVLFGWSRVPASRVLPSGVTDTFAGLRERLSAGQTVVADRTSVRLPDGATLSLSVAAAFVPRPADADDDLVCILTDITQREMLERELQQKQRTEALGRLAGGIAHDFNNLLTVIVGYSDLLAHRMGSEHPSFADVDAIRVAGQQAAAFTEQLLAIYQNRVTEVRAVDLAEAIRNLEPVLRRLVGDGVTFVVDIGEATGHIAIDEGQLEQVLLNLVVNAHDAMPDGGTLVVATSGIDGGDGGPWIELNVRDTGIGMDAATLERCFDPFFTTKGRTKGTGLGLATVYGVIDQAGGEITAESTVGEGTTFRVVFPAASPTTESPPAPPRAARRHNGGGGARKVLLVEDEQKVRAFARLVLTEAGYDVLDAGGAAQALELAGALRAPPSILVTDVLMPGMNGPELATAIAEAHPGVPVLFISGYIEDQRREQLLRDRPSSRFLAKPFTPSDLVAAVDAVLNGAERQGSKR